MSLDIESIHKSKVKIKFVYYTDTRNAYFSCHIDKEQFDHSELGQFLPSELQSDLLCLSISTYTLIPVYLVPLPHQHVHSTIIAYVVQWILHQDTSMFIPLSYSVLTDMLILSQFWMMEKLRKQIIQTVADRIRGKTTDEIRELFHMPASDVRPVVFSFTPLLPKPRSKE